MAFIDLTQIRVKAGDGGNGIVSFHTAHNQPKLGPDGGNGGHGGDVYLVGDKGLNTLSHLRFKQLIVGTDGGRGGTNARTGRCGEARLVKVPLGTVVRDQLTGQSLGEIVNDSEKLLVASGGRRGYGNKHYVRDTYQAPRRSSEGGKGEIRDVSLELKVIAEIGLAGFPNAGKSTLLSRMSAAKPKIANYPFTTLTPQLGVVDIMSSLGYGEQSFVMADIPGLIEGASEGRGLGHDFLRHLERTKMLCYVIEASEERPVSEAFEALRHELEAYSMKLAKKPMVVAINKMDTFDFESQHLEGLSVFEEKGIKVFFISAVTGYGLQELKYYLAEMVRQHETTSTCEVLCL
jgi:GTP-binding protein